jgi:hypothetical protein
MARLDDLVSEVQDATLRKKLQGAVADLGWRTRSSFWWCVTDANERIPDAMALLLRGSTRTL